MCVHVCVCVHVLLHLRHSLSFPESTEVSLGPATQAGACIASLRRPKKRTLSFPTVSGQEDSKPLWPRITPPAQKVLHARCPSLRRERRLGPDSMGPCPKPSFQTLGKHTHTRFCDKEKPKKRPVGSAGESPRVQAGGCWCLCGGPSPWEFPDLDRLCLSCLVRWFWNHT